MRNVILRGRHPEVELKLPAMGLQGYFKWELRRAGKVIRDSGGFHKNLITNSGMNALVTDTLVGLNQAKVGTSAAAPLVTDNGVNAPLGPFVTRDSEAAVLYVAGPPEYLRKTYTFKWVEAQANGNLTEIAIHTVGSGTPCFSHQLFKDGLGNPTVIAKTNLDQLFVTYEWRVYPPAADVNSVIVVSGVNYDCTARPCNVASNSAAWASILLNGPAGAPNVGANSGESNVLVGRNASPSVFNIFGTDATDLTQTAYVADSFYVEHKYVWDLGVANYATGIGLVALVAAGGGPNPPGCYYQFVFPTTKFPKDNTKKLTLFIRRYWARYP